MEVNQAHQMFGYQHSSEYLILCGQKKKEIHTGLKQQIDKIFIFKRTITLISWMCLIRVGAELA